MRSSHVVGQAPPPTTPIPGLRLRRLRGPSDYPGMNEVANEARLAQGIEFYTTDEQFRRFYEHLDNCDISSDLFLAELDGRLIAYVRVAWHDEPALRVYEPIVFLDPGAGSAEIFGALFDVAEARIGEIAANHPVGPKVARTEVTDRPPIIEAGVRARGYEPVRHYFTMVRPTLDDLDDAPMPVGLEIRDVRPEHMEAIYEAEVEAFRDHWGFSEPGQSQRDEFFNDPVRSDTSLWRVAWDGDQVAGMVRSYVNTAENERRGLKRGWVENISVRRPWRRRGLARALIAASFPLLRARGMTEGALGVDTQNLTGALSVYEGCGFQAVSRTSEFGRTIEG